MNNRIVNSISETGSMVFAALILTSYFLIPLILFVYITTNWFKRAKNNRRKLEMAFLWFFIFMLLICAWHTLADFIGASSMISERISAIAFAKATGFMSGFVMIVFVIDSLRMQRKRWIFAVIGILFGEMFFIWTAYYESKLIGRMFSFLCVVFLSYVIYHMVKKIYSADVNSGDALPNSDK